MDDSLYAEIAQLPRLRTDQLRQRYREVFGEETHTRHKQHLVRRIAWRLQALAQGDLSERARQRALEVANDADLRTQVPSQWLASARAAQRPPERRADKRLPAAGTLLTRHYRGRQIVVTVLAEGFDYEGRHYASLSAVAREVTGTRWNGLLFFGLARRKEAGRARR